jgi:hypothetical protein
LTVYPTYVFHHRLFTLRGASLHSLEKENGGVRHFKSTCTPT